MLITRYILCTIFAVTAGSDCVVDEKQVLQVGSPIQLECERPGDGVASFQGPYGNYLRASSNDTNIKVEEEGGNTKMTLTVSEFKDAGTYQCITGSKCRNRTFELYGVVLPLEQFERSQVVRLRMGGVINCTALSNPPAIIAWYFNGAPLKNQEEKYKLDGTNLVIQKSSVADAGNYTCNVSLPSYGVSRAMDIEVSVKEGQLRCFYCKNYNSIDAKLSSQDYCSVSDQRTMSTTSCFTRCLTVVAKGLDKDGSETRFVLRDCGDEYPFESNGVLQKSDIETLMQRYDVTSISAGRASVCEGNECNEQVADYEITAGLMNGGVQSLFQHSCLKLLSYSVIMAGLSTMI